MTIFKLSACFQAYCVLYDNNGELILNSFIIIITATPSIGVLGQKYIEAKVGEAFTAVYEVNYTGSADTEIVLKQPYPAGALFVKDPQTGKYSFTWTPADITPYHIK